MWLKLAPSQISLACQGLRLKQLDISWSYYLKIGRYFEISKFFQGASNAALVMKDPVSLCGTLFLTLAILSIFRCSSNSILLLSYSLRFNEARLWIWMILALRLEAINLTSLSHPLRILLSNIWSIRRLLIPIHGKVISALVNLDRVSEVMLLIYYYLTLRATWRNILLASLSRGGVSQRIIIYNACIGCWHHLMRKVAVIRSITAKTCLTPSSIVSGNYDWSRELARRRVA